MNMKKALTEMPVLAHPDLTKPMRVYTDGCKKGVGAVLAQKQDDGQIRPIMYLSRTTSKNEKNR